MNEIACGVLAAWLSAGDTACSAAPARRWKRDSRLMGGALTAALPLPEPFDVSLTSNAEVIGAALCLPAALRLTRLARRLEAPDRWVASRSHALYLAHLTVLHDVAEKGLFVAGYLSAAGCACVAITVPFLLAEVSCRCLQTPVLRLRPSQATLPGYRTVSA